MDTLLIVLMLCDQHNRKCMVNLISMFSSYSAVSENVWQVMSSSPREKDAWTDALKKILGDKFTSLLPPVVATEVKRTGTNLERSDSKRSEVKSAPVLDNNSDNAAFMRSYSAGATVHEKHRNTTTSSPTPESQRVGFFLIWFVCFKTDFHCIS